MKQEKDTNTNTDTSPVIIEVNGVKMFQKVDGTFQEVKIIPPKPRREKKFGRRIGRRHFQDKRKINNALGGR
jgi:hypothetical protein